MLPHACSFNILLNDNFVKLQFRKLSAAELVSCNETQASEAERIEACRSNYPACEARRGTIPRSGGL